MKQTIIIVGAGAAGLISAWELSLEKYNVILLESQKQSGGRIQTQKLTDDYGVIERGAEFIHGRLPITLGLCEEANMTYIPVEGKMYRKEKNEWIEETQLIEGWTDLIKTMGSLKEDIGLGEFLLKTYPEDKYADFRMRVIAFVEGFDIADPNKASVKALYQEWSHEEEENFRIPDGYGALIRFIEHKCIENGCTIIKGDAVKQIDWQNNEVIAHTASGKKYLSEKIIVTIPIGVLTDIAHKASINFTPAIDDRIAAASDIGYGTVIKVILHFKTGFWKQDTRFIFSQEVFSLWWTQLPLRNNLLTGWAGGPKASHLSRHTDAELLEIALTCLANIFDKDISEIRNNLKQSYVFNWQGYEEALGAYSYATPQTTAARKLLNTPLENTIFFAGEGLYEGDYPGTVEAALASGKQVTKRVLGVH